MLQHVEYIYMNSMIAYFILFLSVIYKIIFQDVSNVGYSLINEEHF